MMLDLDGLREIGHTLGRNKVRTALTAFGVFWGIFMLMVMLGAGNGLQRGVDASFSGTATNTFFMWTQRTSRPWSGLPAGRTFELANSDVEAIRQRIDGASIIAPRIQLGGFGEGVSVERAGRAGGFNVNGDVPEIFRLQSMRLVEGRFLNPRDLEERRKVAVIGQRVLEVLFDRGEDPVGKHVRIQNVPFQVIGVFRPTSSGGDADRASRTIHVPFTTFQQAFHRGDEVDWLAISSSDGIRASAVKDEVETLLKARHRVAPDDRRAFGHFNIEEEYLKVQGLFRGISLLVWIVGFGTLAAGVIGVSNIMTIIVKERTGEIGIRRAIGATPRRVLGQIVLEALLLTGAAGATGLILGAGSIELLAQALAAQGESTTMFRQPGVTFESAVAAMSTLVLAGVIAGLLPARRALAISPVAALQGD
ncbi:MAG: ABC transporter permease [Acidobacteriota bacterium]